MKGFRAIFKTDASALLEVTGTEAQPTLILLIDLFWLEA